MLPSFEIANFRAFRHLRIERLGRVNLLIGKNGVGKTTLLEALRFYGTGHPVALREYLANCEEWETPTAGGESYLDLRALFHDRYAKRPEIEIGPLDDESARIKVTLAEYERVEESDGGYHYDRLTANEVAEGEVVECVSLQRGSRQVLFSPEYGRRPLARGKYVGPAFVSSGGVREAELSAWWDEIALTPSQDRVMEALSLASAIDGVAAVAHPMNTGARVFKARLRGDRAPVPLKSLGEGLVHIFQLAVAIEYAHESSKYPHSSPLFDDPEDRSAKQWPRLLLVDEIENGIHHTLHARLWQFIFRLARMHDLQVFVTTHSLDCLRGFAEAVAADEDNDGLVIRLEKKEGRAETRAVTYDKTELPIVAREEIEVR